jgi:putative pyruvate formate lyase activating enzyme
VDIYLPDMKYSNNALAKALSKAPDYVETASAAILEMYRQTGPVVVEDEIMERGVLLRHLILPGQIDNSLGVLDWVDEHFRPGEILFSLMAQYTPMGRAKTMEGLNRTITEEEYDAVLSYLDLLGIEDGFTQDFHSATEQYIPKWDLSGL